MTENSSVAVLMPIVGDDPWRTRAAGFVLELYREFFPDWQIIVCRSEQTPFCRGHLLNQAVTDTEADVIVLADADSLVQPHQALRAAHLAAESPGLIFGYTRYRKLSVEATSQLDSWAQAFRLPDECFEWEQLNAGSQGCAAIQRSCFNRVGGFDPKFVGWGFEDLAFDVMCEAHWPSRRVAGDLIHLWHPTAEGTPLASANEARYLNEYVPRFGDKDALRNLVMGETHVQTVEG